MANIINITESANRLDFSDAYSPIVCGNSNYYLHFTFDEIWKRCEQKTALFVVEGKKMYVDFEGEDVHVPVLPNAQFVFVSLISGEGNNQIATTSIKIRLEPTALGGDMSEFDQLASYLPKVHAAINDLKNGSVVAKQAENANFASEADLAGTANYANKAKIAQNVVNENLLINGDFKINQRGKTTAGYDSYFVDRWKTRYNNPDFTTIKQNDDKSIHMESSNEMWPYLLQILDVELSNYLKKKKVTLSYKVKNVVNEKQTKPQFAIETKTGANYVAIIWGEFSEDGVYHMTMDIPEDYDNLVIRTSCSPCASYDVEWVKLELGDQATDFVPKSPVQELEECKRYYQIFKDTYGTADNPTYIGSLYSVSEMSCYMQIDLPVSMRVVPTRVTETLSYKYMLNTAQAFTSITFARNDNMINKLKLYGEGSFVPGACIPVTVYGDASYLELDAEIY